MQVAFEEPSISDGCNRLRDLDADYGDMPAHDGLWQRPTPPGTLTALLAVVPLILEARGLDVTPSLQKRCAKPATWKALPCWT